MLRTSRQQPTRRPAMEEGIKFFVGLDVHKDTIAVAVAEAGRAPARLVGSIAHDVGKLLKLLARYGEPAQVQVVYEAGPTGYGLQRELARRGYQLPGDCAVVDSEACGRSGQDRPSRWLAPGRARACRRIARGVDSGSGRRGDSRLGPCARGCGQRPYPGTAATQRLPAAPRRALCRQDLVEQDLTTAGWRR